MGLAGNDLVKTAQYLVSIGHDDPRVYMEGIRSRLEAMYTNKNPGVVGRRAGTHEWMLNPTPYVAVIKWVGQNVKIYRVLPSAKIKTSRPSIGVGHPRATFTTP